jgi:cytochrome c553
MKNKLTLLVVLACGLGLLSFNISNLNANGKAGAMPDNVKAAIDKSCFGCHNTAASGKAKEKLDFSTLAGLSKAVQIAKYKNISKTIQNGEMPPKRFLENNPDKKLTADEVKIVIKWTEKEVKKLMKK